MKNFDLSACAISIATAMVTTIKSGDDVARIHSIALGEGFENMSDWIADNAVKQSTALAVRLIQAQGEYPEFFPMEVMHIPQVGKSASPAASDQHSKDTPTHAANASVGHGKDPINTSGAVDMSTAPSAEAPELQNFDVSAAAVFGGPNAAGSATGSVAPPTVNASIAPAVGATETPLAPAVSAAAPVDTTSTNTTTGIASSVDLDSEGMPWDGRIHSSSKKKLVENGRWKLIRGVDKDLVDSVKAEHLSTATETQGLHPDANPLSVAAVNHATAQMGKPAPAVTTGTPADPAASGPITNFAQLMSAITSKGLKPEQINPILQAFGIASMPVLATKQDLIPAVAAGLGL